MQRNPAIDKGRAAKFRKSAKVNLDPHKFFEFRRDQRRKQAARLWQPKIATPRPSDKP